jgi:hypothetical protein
MLGFFGDFQAILGFFTRLSAFWVLAVSKSVCSAESLHKSAVVAIAAGQCLEGWKSNRSRLDRWAWHKIVLMQVRELWARHATARDDCHAGVGYKMESRLAMIGVTSVVELRCKSLRELAACCGDSSASTLAQLALGKDSSPVIQSGPPKSITCEDSFKACSSLKGVESVVRLCSRFRLLRVPVPTKVRVLSSSQALSICLALQMLYIASNV